MPGTHFGGQFSRRDSSILRMPVTSYHIPLAF